MTQLSLTELNCTETDPLGLMRLGLEDNLRADTIKGICTRVISVKR